MLPGSPFYININDEKDVQNIWGITAFTETKLE